MSIKSFISQSFFICMLFAVVQGYESIKCQCPNKWVTFQGSCYFFGHSGVHFKDAQNYCKRYNATLVEIESFVESAFLKDYISRVTGSRFWIGLTDLQTEGVWKWSNTNAAPSYKDWAPNEPNAWAPVDDCAVLAKDYNNRWIDESCYINYLAICEKR